MADRHRRRQAQHVDGAAAHTSPSTRSPPKGSQPVGRIRRDDVGMPHEEQAGAAGSEPSMRARRLARPGGARSAGDRHRALQVGSEESALRDSPPESGVPSLDADIADELLQQAP